MYFNRICLIRELDLTRSEPTARISLLWFIIQMKTEFRLLVQYKGLIQNSLFAVVGPRGWGPKSSLYCSCNLPCSSYLYVSMYLFIVACIFSVVVALLVKQNEGFTIKQEKCSEELHKSMEIWG